MEILETLIATEQITLLNEDESEQVFRRTDKGRELLVQLSAIGYTYDIVPVVVQYKGKELYLLTYRGEYPLGDPEAYDKILSFVHDQGPVKLDTSKQ